MITHENCEALFHRPLSVEARHQFEVVQNIILNTHVSDQKDIWSYTWTSKTYSSMKMYRCIIGPSTSHHIFKLLWKTSAMLRHKIFFWLLLYDKVNTRNLLLGKKMYLESYNCVLCSDQVEETALHLFWDCPFALNCWNEIMPDKKRGISSLDA